MLYPGKTLKQIIVEEALAPDQLPEVFTTAEMIAWAKKDYPLFKESTIRMHLIALSANDPNKKHYRGSRTVWRNKLFKLGPNQFRRYQPDSDPPPLPLDEEGGEEPDEESPDEEAVNGPEMAFALEKHLEEFMESNWDRIEFGTDLRMYSDEGGRPARQFPTSVGLIDFLCHDEGSGDLVVVELKKGRPSDKVIGQCQRYMGWVKKNLAEPNQEVRGLIIAPEPDERLKYALAVAPNIELRCYKVDFELFDPAEDSQT